MQISLVEANSPLFSVSSSSAAPGLRQEQSRPAPGAEISSENMRKLVEEMQSHISTMNVNLRFSTYGERGEKIAIMVVNEETGEVIREIPAKEIQALHAKMTELAGMIFSENA